MIELVPQVGGKVVGFLVPNQRITLLLYLVITVRNITYKLSQEVYGLAMDHWSLSVMHIRNIIVILCLSPATHPAYIDVVEL